MKKKSWISLLIVLALSTILLLPIPKGHTDSGARVYRALTYKIVQWNQQVVNTKIRLTIFFAAKEGEALYSQQKQDQELTVAQIMNSLLQNSDLNSRK